MPRRYWDDHGYRGEERRSGREYWREGEDIRSAPRQEGSPGDDPRRYGGTRDMDFGSGWGGGRERGGGDRWDERGGGHGPLAGTRGDLDPRGMRDRDRDERERWGGSEPDRERWDRDRGGDERRRRDASGRDRWHERADEGRRWSADRDSGWDRDRAGSRGGGWFVPGRDDESRRHETGDFWERDIHGRMRDWSARPRDDRSGEERYRSAYPWFGADFGAQSWRGEWESRDRDEYRRREPEPRVGGRGPKGYKRSDERIREDVCERIARSPIRSEDVEVQVESGEVTLSGHVDSRDDKRRLEDLVDDVFGVDEVHDHLRLRRETRSEDAHSDVARSEDTRGDDGHGQDGGLPH